MEKVYRHSASTYIALFFFAFILFLLFKIFLAAFESGSFVYIALTFIACALWMRYTLKTLKNALKKTQNKIKGFVRLAAKELGIDWEKK